MLSSTERNTSGKLLYSLFHSIANYNTFIDRFDCHSHKREAHLVEMYLEALWEDDLLYKDEDMLSLKNITGLQNNDNDVAS